MMLPHRTVKSARSKLSAATATRYCNAKPNRLNRHIPATPYGPDAQSSGPTHLDHTVSRNSAAPLRRFAFCGMRDGHNRDCPPRRICGALATYRAICRHWLKPPFPRPRQHFQSGPIWIIRRAKHPYRRPPYEMTGCAIFSRSLLPFDQKFFFQEQFQKAIPQPATTSTASQFLHPYRPPHGMGVWPVVANGGTWHILHAMAHWLVRPH